MPLSTDEFSRLADADKLMVVYSELLHLRTGVQSAAELEGQALRNQEQRLRVAELDLAVLRGQLRALTALGLAIFGVALVSLAKALGV